MIDPLCPIAFGIEIENTTITQLDCFLTQRKQGGSYCFNSAQKRDLCELVSFAGGSPQILNNLIDDLVYEKKLQIRGNLYFIEPN